MNENELSYKIIGAAIELHKNIGPGLLESAYENALAYDLNELGLEVKQEVGYRLNLVINNKVIVEIKAIEALAPVHFAQLLTYLKLSDMKLGLLINFNCKFLKNEIHRVVNGL